MTKTALYPLTFTPVLKSYLWGGRGLESHLGRPLPDGPVAESWEISAHRQGPTRVDRGAFAGLSLAELQEQLGADLLGEHNRRALDLGRFPLLVKLLDAHDWLSVQVHPPDSYALEREDDLGKSEMWVVLHAEPGAELILGFRAGADRPGFERAVRAGEAERWLHRVPAAAGDVFFVPAGTIHAIGPGVLVAEIQQSSDTTYRIHDWDRVDRDGKPRPLHVGRALEVLDYSLVAPGAVRPQPRPAGGWIVEELAACPYFRTERLTAETHSELDGECSGETFEIWGVLEGRISVSADRCEPLELAGVGWTLLPAALGRYRVAASAGSRLLRVTTPAPESIAG